MADKVTVATLHQMKREHRRIVASVCYEYTMAQILERAGADLLSVGDSVGRAFLGYDDPDAMTVDEMLPFCRAVSRAAKRAIVNCDMPGSAVKGGPQSAAEAARRMADAGAELVKVDIREDWDGLMPVVEAVLKTGVATYPQIGFPALGPRHGGPEVLDRAMKKAQQLQDAGASLLDCTAFTPEVYSEICAAIRLPVVGGQTGPEADGKIYVSYALVATRWPASTVTMTAPTPRATSSTSRRRPSTTCARATSRRAKMPPPSGRRRPARSGRASGRAGRPTAPASTSRADWGWRRSWQTAVGSGRRR